MLCAYAKLETPNTKESVLDALAKEMQSKNIVPSTLHRTLYAFDMTKESMDKLINVLKNYWPSLPIDHRYAEPYFLVCMTDMLKRGELSIDVFGNEQQQELKKLQQQEESDHQQQRVKLLKEKMKEALKLCSQVTSDISVGTIGRWTQLLSYYGDYIGVKAAISFALEQVNESLKPDAEVLSRFNLLLIGAYINAHELDEPIKVLDEMKSSGFMPNNFHYNQLLKALASVSDIEERRKHALELYLRMLDDNLTPDTSSLILIRKQLSPQSDKVVKKQKK